MVNLDFNVLVFLIGFIFALPIIGYLFRFQIPISIFFLIAGVFLISIFLMTDRIIIERFAFLDGAVDTIFHYNIESFTGQLALNNGGSTAHAEFASASNSMLVGDEINCIDIMLRKSGSPTGTATIGTLDGSGSIIQQFGTINVAILTTSNIWYTFCLSGDNSYVIANQDRLGIAYNGGNATNNIQVSQDANNPFDGTITIRQQYAGSWTSGSTSDLTMRFYLTGQESEVVNEERTMDIRFEGEYYQIKVIMIFIAVMFMVGGALVEVKQR